MTIKYTRLEQQWLSDKTASYTPLVNQSRSPYVLFLSLLLSVLLSLIVTVANQLLPRWDMKLSAFDLFSPK